jgi:hypothetical protein
MEPARLAAPVGPWLSQSRRDRDGDAPQAVVLNLELVAFADGRLVDVPGEDQLGTGVDETRQHLGAAGNGLLPRPPRRPDQVVMERDDLERVFRRAGQ